MLHKYLNRPASAAVQNLHAVFPHRSWEVQPSNPQMALPPLEAQWRTLLIRAVAVLALIVGLVYLIWRAVFTVDLVVWWISIPLLVCEVHALVGLVLYTFSLWDVNSRPPTWRVEATSAKVAVLIPTYNEDPEVLLPTIAAAVAMRLPHETWVLDDGNRPWVQQLATELGARYLTRPDRAHAKAGNINHALSHIDADYVAILDADHVALPNLLTNTLGYFDDPRVALVQTPQDFYNLNSFEHDTKTGDARLSTGSDIFHEQALFYRLLQPGKNRWDAAFWCGTSAIVRVAALRDVGGIAVETITEDIHTSIRLHQRGWKTIYHNEVLARGLAASNAIQYLGQRLRWGTGAMQVLRTDNPLTARGLRLPQRLAYATTLLGWFDAWRSLAYLILPIVVLATGAVPIRAQMITFLVVFGVTFVLQQTAMRLLSRGFYRPIMSTMFELVRMPANVLATLTLLRPKGLRFQVTSKGRTGDKRQRMPVPRLLIGITVASFAAMLWFAATIAGLTPLRYDVPWAAYGSAFWLSINTMLVIYAMGRIHSAKYGTERRRSIRFVTTSKGFLNERPCEVCDVSLTGALIRASASDMAAEHESITVNNSEASNVLTMVFDDVEIKLHGIIRSQRMLPSGQTQYGLEFCGGQDQARAKLSIALFDGEYIQQFEEAPQMVYA